MLRGLRSLIILILLLITTIMLLRWSGMIPSFRQLFSAAPLQIDKTPVLVKEVRAMASLVTITAFDEVVADSAYADPTQVTINALTGLNLNVISPLYSQLVIVAKGRIILGTDLKKMGDSAIHVSGDSVFVNLPAAEILEIVVNPSGFETFIETGTWSNDAVTKVKIKAREKMNTRAIQEGLLKKANERAVFLIREMLESLGFEKVEIRVG